MSFITPIVGRATSGDELKKGGLSVLFFRLKNAAGPASCFTQDMNV
jgi:hypothetical protein